MVVVLIASVGPMASSNLSGYLELFGVSHFPQRRIGLEHLLVNNTRSIQADVKRRFLERLEVLEKPRVQGGLSPDLRDKGEAVSRVNSDNWDSDSRAEFSSTHFDVSNLVIQLLKIWRLVCSYKRVEDSINGFSYHYNPMHGVPIETLEKNCARHNASDSVVKFICLSVSRPFVPWINGMIDQQMVKKQPRIGRFSRYRRFFEQYDDQIKSGSVGHVISFEELVPGALAEIERGLFKRLATILNFKLIGKVTEDHQVDLYGSHVLLVDVLKQVVDNEKYVSARFVGILDQLIRCRLTFVADVVFVLFILKQKGEPKS